MGVYTVRIVDSVFIFRDYGRINIRLERVLHEKKVTRTLLARLTGVSYNTINRYYLNRHIENVNLDIISKICYVLECGIEDILEYVREDMKA